jgi:hypothetical protein
MDVPFGAWEPDRSELESGIADGANILPIANGWGPMPGLFVTDSAEAVPDPIIGGYATQDTSGGWLEFVAGGDKVYRLANDFTLNTIDSGRTPTDGDDWSFQQFGAYLLYTNTTDGLIAYNVETGGAVSVIAAAMNPRVVFECANQVVALDCLNANGDRDNKLLRTSAIGNHTEWAKNGADYQPIQDGGALVGGCKLTQNTAFIAQEQSLRLMQFGAMSSGSNFSLTMVSAVTGAVGMRSIVPGDGVVGFLATDGYYLFSAGGGLKNIGAERVNRWFLDTVDQSALTKVQGALDPLRKIMWWRFKRASDVSDTVTQVMIGYSLTLDRWIPPVLVPTTYLMRSATPGFLADDVDTLMDDLDFPADGRYFDGGQPQFGAFDENGKFGYFIGGSLPASITSRVANSPVSDMIGRATGIDDAPSGTLTLGTKDALSDPINWRAPAGRGRAGSYPLRGRGLNIAFRRDIPAGAQWSYAKGVDHVSASAGGRT